MKFLVLLLLAGCTASNEYKLSSDLLKTCVDGVQYYHYDRGITPAYNVDGTIKTCGETK